VRDVRNCDADPQVKALALAELTGTLILFDGVRQADTPDRVTINARLIGRLKDPLECTLSLASDDPTTAATLTPPQSFPLVTYKPRKVAASCRVATLEPVTVTATFSLSWRGQTVSVPFTQTIANTSIPRWWVIGPFHNPGGATADVKNPVETEAIDLAKKYPGQGGEIAWRKVERPANAPIFAEYAIDLNQTLGYHENASAYALVYVDSDKAQDAVLALGSDDGVVAWLNDKQVHRNLVGRGYASQSDRVSVHLNQGRNKLLVKITQGNGGWAFGAHLFKKDGGFLPGVRYSLDQQPVNAILSAAFGLTRNPFHEMNSVLRIPKVRPAVQEPAETRRPHGQRLIASA